MTIRVLLFASYADALGANELPMQGGVGLTVRDVLQHVRSLPGAAMLPPSPMMAVNASYASLDFALSDGDEVAIIPPVAGG